jgi:hypothetical protein
LADTTSNKSLSCSFAKGDLLTNSTATPFIIWLYLWTHHPFCCFKLWVSMGWIKTDEPKAITKGLSEFDSSNGAAGIENESVKIKLWIGRAEDLCYLWGQAVHSLLSLCCRKRR